MKNLLPPEYFSEVLLNRLGIYYFNVLSVLDSEVPNSVHKTIAWLAHAKCLSAVITTNFDLCLESAMRQVGVEPLVWKCSEDFNVSTIGTMKKPVDADERRCVILKIHGSADAPSSVIDTLSQRSLGLANEIRACLVSLLHSSPWLFIGYSGADLAATPQYLELRTAAEKAVGWTWLVKSDATPNYAVTALREEYHGKGIINALNGSCE